MGHDDLNKSVSDSRCFVASHLYGATDERTESLREFRDQKLLGHLLGRALIHAYYAISPPLVALCQRFPVLDKVIKPLVDRCASAAKRRMKKCQRS
ncbi:CFI-box-CTERM domain-containing protein [Zhongshania marina]